MINNAIAIIDCDSLIFHSFHPNKHLDENKQPIKIDGKFSYYEKTEEQIKESVDYLMGKIFTETNCDGWIAFVKGKNTTNARKSINPLYKDNRNKESPKWWEFTKQYFIDKYKAIEVNDMEVDDIVNITRLSIPNSFITALDKDLLHLEGVHFNWSTAKWIEVTKEEADCYFWSDMIIGQPGDNIKGLPGKGVQFAKGMIIEANINAIDYSEIVLHEYIKQFGEEEGIEEYYKNYRCLKILSKLDDFKIPSINLINKEIDWI